MNLYFTIKTLHILSATLMVGTGFGSAFYLFWANRSGSVAAQAVVGRWVIKADWWFTTPAVIFQPLSGLWLAQHLGWPLSATWLWLALAFLSEVKPARHIDPCFFVWQLQRTTSPNFMAFPLGS